MQVLVQEHNTAPTRLHRDRRISLSIELMYQRRSTSTSSGVPFEWNETTRGMYEAEREKQRRSCSTYIGITVTTSNSEHRIKSADIRLPSAFVWNSTSERWRLAARWSGALHVSSSFGSENLHPDSNVPLWEITTNTSTYERPSMRQRQGTSASTRISFSALLVFLYFLRYANSLTRAYANSIV